MIHALAIDRCNRSETGDVMIDGYLQEYGRQLETLEKRVASLTTRLADTYPGLSQEITRSLDLAELVYLAVCDQVAVDNGYVGDNLRPLLDQLMDDVRAVHNGLELLLARTSR